MTQPHDDNNVLPCFACPLCGERNADRLQWLDDGRTVRCTMCGTEYQPDGEAHDDDQTN